MAESATKPAPNDLAAFDVARAGAALAVLFAHGRSFVLLDVKDQPALSSVGRMFYGLTAPGHQAVVVFFVVSGALVTRSMLGLEAGGNWSWRSFAGARLTRLWTVLLPCLVLGGCLDTMGLLLGDQLVYAGHYGALRVADPPAPIRLDPTAFAGNLAFLQTIAVAPFGTNVPLWSLAYEAWYYVAAFLAWSAWRERTRPMRAVGFLAGLLVIVGWTLTPDMRALAPTWLAGAALTVAVTRRASGYRLHTWDAAPPSSRSGEGTARRAGGGVLGAMALLQGLIASTAMWKPDPDPGEVQVSPVPIWLIRAAALALLLATIAAARASAAHHQLAGDYAVACATVLCLFAARDWQPSPSAALRAIRRVAWLSYSLYLSHFPLLALLAATVLRNRRQPFGTGAVLTLAAVLALALIYAAAIWWCFERHTPAVRRWVSGWAGASRGSASGVALTPQGNAR